MFRLPNQPTPVLSSQLDRYCGKCGLIVKGFVRLKKCPVKNCCFDFPLTEGWDKATGFGRCEGCSRYLHGMSSKSRIMVFNLIVSLIFKFSIVEDLCCESCGRVNTSAVQRARAKKRKLQFDREEELKRLRSEVEELRQREAERLEDQRLASAADEAEKNAKRNSEAEGRKKAMETSTAILTHEVPDLNLIEK